jgi:release factor glutamine methyltransferase
MNSLNKNMTLIAGEALAQAYIQLKDATDTPQLDAQLLLTEVLKVSRAKLIANPDLIINDEQHHLFKSLILRRMNAEPIAYLHNRKEFYSRIFYVDPTVLVPRPETEHLVDCAISIIDKKNILTVLDIATGSGIIAITLKKECPCIEVTASDMSHDAIGTAIKNAEAFKVDISFVYSDVFSEIKGTYDLIISNPPYVPTDLVLSTRELSLEPRMALDGGGDGMDVLKNIISSTHKHLNKDGYLILEHADNQADEVQQIGGSCNLKFINTIYDLQSFKRGTLFQVNKE